MTLTVIWVAGATAAGKTTWIRDQIAMVERPCAYCRFGAAVDAGSLVDRTYLSYVSPDLKVLPTLPTTAELDQLGDRVDYLFVEIDPAVLTEPAGLSCLPELPAAKIERVLIQAPNMPVTLGWAQQTIVGGMAVELTVAPTASWQTIDLSGEILDPPSLAMVWTELIQGAYGQIPRAKALFETIEGYPLYFDYVAGCAPVDYEELEIARNLKGRPQRFSGIAVLGEINQAALKQSLQDASLDDRLIEYYQAQINQMLTAPR